MNPAIFPSVILIPRAREKDPSGCRGARLALGFFAPLRMTVAGEVFFPVVCPSLTESSHHG